MGYLIGVDGGGTGCRVLVADENGTELGRAEGGAANIATNLKAARSNILAAVATAFDSAGLEQTHFKNSTAILGLAGANLGDYQAQLLSTLPFARAKIISDAETTLTGAIGEVEGCVAAIGTGSVYGRRDSTGFSQIGGWGFLLGDDGSGARLGRDLLHHAILAHDDVIPHSELTREILDEYDRSPSKLVESAKTFAPGEFGRFAPRIVAAAKKGDEIAESILAHHTEIVRLSIEAAGFDPAKAFCMLGGLGPIYLARLDPKYQQATQQRLGNALDGALTLAQKLLRES